MYLALTHRLVRPVNGIFRFQRQLAVSCTSFKANNPLEFHRVSDRQKTKLVQAKFYKSVDEVPDFLGRDAMRKGSEFQRLRHYTYGILFIIVLYFVVIMYARQTATPEMQVDQRMLRKINVLQEQGNQERQEKAAAAAALNFEDKKT